MYPSDEDIPGPSVAETPPKPAPAAPHRQSDLESRHIPPHPREPLTPPAMRAGLDTGSKLLVWGGIALGVAGLTAGAILATRRLTSGPAPEKERPQRSDRYEGRNEHAVAPRFAEMDEEEREAIRRRVRARARADERVFEGKRAEASRRRSDTPRKNIAQDLTETANDLSASLTGVAGSVATAFESFRGVASQASGIIGEFAVVADQLRRILHGAEPARQAPDRADPQREPEREAQQEPNRPEGDDPRYHRL